MRICVRYRLHVCVLAGACRVRACLVRLHMLLCIHVRARARMGGHAGAGWRTCGCACLCIYLHV